MGIILTSDGTIPPITDARASDALPIAGRYRVIDFVVSNMANAGIQNIGVATRYNYSSLMNHLRVGEPWDLDRKNGGLRVLPPNLEKADMGHIKGTIDMLDGIRAYISERRETYVALVLSSGIYNIDLAEAVEYHIDKQADITIIYKEGLGKDATDADYSRFTLLKAADDNRITDIAVQPFYPNSNLVSMDILIMEKALLESIIDECIARGDNDFLKDAIIKRMSSMRIFGYKHDGVYSKIDSMKSYFATDMAFLNADYRNAIFDADRPIYTRSTAQSPTSYGSEAVVENCFVSDGCSIEGEVKNCVLSRRVKIGKGAIVKDSIVMQDCTIEEGAVVDHVVLDKDVHITKGRKLIGTDSYPLAIAKGTLI